MGGKRMCMGENVPLDGAPYHGAPARLACDLCESKNESRPHSYDNAVSHFFVSLFVAPSMSV